MYFAAALTLLSLGLSAQGVKDEKFTPFYTKDEAPKMEKVIPNPPELTDAQFFYDWTQYQWGKSIRDTERGQLAVLHQAGRSQRQGLLPSRSPLSAVQGADECAQA